MAIGEEYFKSIAENVKQQLPDEHAFALVVCEFEGSRRSEDGKQQVQIISNANNEALIGILEEMVEKLKEEDKNNQYKGRSIRPLDMQWGEDIPEDDDADWWKK